MEKDIQLDIEAAEEIIKGGKNNEKVNRSLIFPFSTENIKGYYDRLDLKDKHVLTVTSSGDHALSAILYGAKEVDCFDINRFATHYARLKTAGICSLDSEEFSKNIMLGKNLIFDLKTYDHVRGSLMGDSKLLWDYLYDKYSYEQISTKLFDERGFIDKELLKRIPYLNPQKYYLLKEQLINAEIKYMESCITKLSLNIKDNKYDIMILSNISDWIAKHRSPEELQNVRNIVETLSKNLNERGSIMFGYSFQNVSSEEMYPEDKLANIFNNQNCDRIYVEGSFPEDDDLVLVYKK